MFVRLRSNIHLKTVFIAVMSLILVISFLGINKVYANSEVKTDEVEENTENVLEAASINLEIDFTSETEVNGAFKTFINNFNDLSDSEILGYINEFLLFLDQENNVNSQLEMFNILNFEKEELKPLVDFMNTHEVASDQAYAEEFEAITPEHEEDQNEVSLFSNDVFTSSTATNTVTRLSGNTRFQTAVEISKNGWANSQAVVIANSHNFADALAGVPLAVELNAPILLSRTDKLEDATIKEIQRLGATRAIILGGEKALSKSVENKLSQLGLSITRYAGETRYDTAAAIANEVRSRTQSSEAFLVSGEDFADAMSVAAVAGRRGAPIYLTRSKDLAEQPKKMASKIPSWYVVGGTSAISVRATDTLYYSGASKQKRIAGENRYETNIKVQDFFGINNTAYVATGRDFVDALTGSVLAAKNNTGIVLVNEVESNQSSALSFTKNNDIVNYTLFGGEIVLPANIVEMFKYGRVEGKKTVVVIDPGHGGSFYGAVYGIAEKALNLETSLKLRDKLNSSGEYEVVMTRTTDKHFSTTLATDLSYRSKIANDLNADMFVSIHYNAGPSGSKGLETFVHHDSYPAQVNRDELNISDPRIKSSRDLADYVQNKMVLRTGLYNRGVKGLNLAVLRQTEMPAILLELGFMSDSNELSKVRTDQYKETVTGAIKEGIDSYFGN